MTSDLRDRPGYDQRFLANEIAAPDLALVLNDVPAVDGDPVLRYAHFSLAMSASRRLAYWAAWNIDGGRLLGDDAPGRESQRFRPDPRLPAGLQTLNDVYRDNRLDRGHLARRADLLWGTPVEAEQANDDSFYFTNIAPQMDNFNQSRAYGLWGRLENAVLDRVDVDGGRLTVQAGPVLGIDDPPYRSVRVPVQYWKLVAYEVRGELRCRAFLMAQQIALEANRDPLDAFAVYRVALRQLADKTQLGYAARLLDAERAGDVAPLETDQPQLIRSPDDVPW